MSEPAALTPNERLVVVYAVWGHSTKLIAYEVGFSPAAVSSLLSAALRKLRLRSRAELLESVLEPSRRVEPKYAAYVAHTAAGLSHTGLLVQRDAKVVVLRDAQNKEVILNAAEVEVLRPSRTSLMPEGQLAGLTAQEAADLLEYLVSRK